MTEHTELSAVLAGNDVAQSEAPVTQAQEAQPASTEKGEPAKADNSEASPAPAPQKEKSDTDKAFAALNRTIKELKRQIASQAAPPLPPKVVDPVTDLEGFNTTIEQRLAQTQLETRLAISEQIVSEKYEDFEEMRDAFMEAAQSDPSLAQAMFAARNPAEFAYKYAKEARARQDIGDPVQYAEKIRNEERQRLAADIDKLVEAKLKERLNGILPTSLASEQTQGTRVTNPSGFSGPTPLESILQTK